MRLGAGPLFVLPTQTPRLVSLSCRVKGDRVHEPVTGWKGPSGAPLVQPSAAVRKRLTDRDVRHSCEQGAFRSFDWIRKFMTG